MMGFRSTKIQIFKTFDIAGKAKKKSSVILNLRDL
jgi:hypothetical protein